MPPRTSVIVQEDLANPEIKIGNNMGHIQWREKFSN